MTARSRSGGWTTTILFGALALALGGCGSLSGGLHNDALSLAAPPGVVLGAVAPADEPAVALPEVSATALGAEPVPAAAAEAAVCESDAAAAQVAAVETQIGSAGDAAPADESVELTVEPITGDALSPPILALADSMLLAQASGSRPGSEPQIEEYDPLEGFNEAMFEFNRTLDRLLIKPVAKAYNFVMPDELQQMIGRGFSNINFVPRLVNNVLQGKWSGAGREVARFLINSVVGIGGLWDMAKQEWDIESSKADFGQTLGKWGAGPGAYLVLPFLPPLTVRDGIGYAVDGAMDPLSYLVPFVWDRLGMKLGDTVNDRSINLELFQGFEETTVDFYAAVRNAYLQRRHKLIREE